MSENQIINYAPSIEEIALAISKGALEKARKIAKTLPKRIKKKKKQTQNIQEIQVSKIAPQENIPS